MIATGTDVKPIEIVFFMRTVKSRGYFEQMKGRGVRVIDADCPAPVTQDAPAKTHFVIVDAVGVSETELIDTPPMERKRSISFSRLLETVAWGSADAETISSLAFRLSRLDKELSPQGQEQFAAASGGMRLREIVQGLIEAGDPDRQIERARQMADLPPDAEPEPAQVAAAREELLAQATAPLASNPTLRETLLTLQAQAEQVIDTVSKDELIEAGFSAEATERAKATIGSFHAFIEQNRDQIDALQILYSQPYGAGLRYKDIRALALAIQAPPWSLSNDVVWQAYAQLHKSRVRGSGRRVLVDIVSLIRFELGIDPELTPFAEQVNARFATWLAAQEGNGRRFTAEQRRFLELIRDHIASS